jgi:hypothetical protein
MCPRRAHNPYFLTAFMEESILMFSAKYAAVAIVVMFIALAYSASASSGKSVQALGSSQEIQLPANNSSLMDNSTTLSPAAVQPSAGATESSGKTILDLSGYARDRTNKNLTGYKNIMYPISGSRGSTTSTTGGGGGCGCG